MFALLEAAGFKRIRSTIVPGFRFRKDSTRDAAEEFGVKAGLFTAQRPAAGKRPETFRARGGKYATDLQHHRGAGWLGAEHGAPLRSAAGDAAASGWLLHPRLGAAPAPGPRDRAGASLLQAHHARSH